MNKNDVIILKDEETIVSLLNLGWDNYEKGLVLKCYDKEIFVTDNLSVSFCYLDGPVPNGYPQITFSTVSLDNSISSNNSASKQENILNRILFIPYPDLVCVKSSNHKELFGEEIVVNDNVYKLKHTLYGYIQRAEKVFTTLYEYVNPDLVVDGTVLILECGMESETFTLFMGNNLLDNDFETIRG